MRASEKGFTLAELAVTLGVSAIALTALFGLFMSQQRMSSASESVRTAQEAGRRALTLLDRDLHRAGFGIDPPLVFDFNGYPGYDRPAACSTGATAPCPRDRTDGPDQLVFMARVPDYQLGGPTPLGKAWLYHGTSGGLQLAARAGDVFTDGRVLEVVCASGGDSAYVTVSQTTTATGDGQLTIPLEAAGTDPWHGQGKLSTALCFNNGADSTTMVFEVDRFHFFVNAYDTFDGTGPQPWLMLDEGLDVNGDAKVDSSDWLPVAAGVEDFQVAYVMNQAGGYTAPDDNKDWIFGNGTTAETPDPAAAAPQYVDGQLADSRYTANPANVRTVRYTLVLRALEPSLAAGDPPPLVENHQTGFPQAAQYRRFTLTGMAPTPNLESRRRFLF